MRIAHRFLLFAATTTLGLALLAAISLWSTTSIQSEVVRLTTRATPLHTVTLESLERIERLSASLMRLAIARTDAEVDQVAPAVEEVLQRLDALDAEGKRLGSDIRLDLSAFREASSNVLSAARQRIADGLLYEEHASLARDSLRVVEGLLGSIRNDIRELDGAAGRDARTGTNAVGRQRVQALLERSESVALEGKGLIGSIRLVMLADNALELDQANAELQTTGHRIGRNLDALREGLEQMGRTDAALNVGQMLGALATATDAMRQMSAGRGRVLASESAVRMAIARVKELATTWSAEGEERAGSIAADQKSVVSTVNAAVERSFILVLGLSCVIAIMVIFQSWTTTRSIARRLASAVGVAETVAAGRLTPIEVGRSNDEIGRLLKAMNRMVTTLRATVTDIQGVASEVASTSRQQMAGSADLANRTEEQTRTIGDISDQLDQITHTVAQNAENARRAHELTRDAAQVAQSGAHAMSRVVDTMQEITETSRRISEIVKVIDGIAFQTNILALNASVEAARAGEFGRGFMVVANEVRSLAHRSKAAAQEVAGLAGTSASRVASGAGFVRDAKETIGRAVDSVNRVQEFVAGIAQASREQSSGLEQVNRSLAEVGDITRQNAGLVQESAVGATDLNDQAEALARAVAFFTDSMAPADAAPDVPAGPDADVAAAESSPSIEPAEPLARAA